MTQERYIDKGDKGRYDIKNKLNELTGKEWIKFTKSWFIHNPPPRSKRKILHPASFPETLIQEFVEFFTKGYQWVLDPFLGTGSTLLACQNCKRNGIGIEISPKYAKIAEQRLSQKKLFPETKQIVIIGNSRDVLKIWDEHNFPKVDFVITSPPYWNQLKRASMRQKERVEKGLDTQYTTLESDIGNIDDYEEFLSAEKEIFDKVYEVIKNLGYLVVIINNVYTNGRLYPLAFDTFRILSDRWIPKDEKIWLQNDKPLIPLGVNTAWIANRHHEYCLIFRKESDEA